MYRWPNLSEPADYGQPLTITWRWNVVAAIATAVAAIAAAVSANLAAHSNRIAADAATATKNELRLEESPALAIRCEYGAKGTGQYQIPLWDRATSISFPVSSGGHPVPSYNFLTCTLTNYARLPVLNIDLFLPAYNAAVVSPHKVVPFGRIEHVLIPGLGSQQSVVVWVENASTNTELHVWTPNYVEFDALPDFQRQHQQLHGQIVNFGLPFRGQFQRSATK